MRSAKCKPCGKIGYFSSVDAGIKADSAARFYGVEMRTYRCPTTRGMWHTARKKVKSGGTQ